MAAAAQEEMAQMAADADTERAAAGEPPLHADAEGGGSSPGLEHGTAPLADDFTAEELAARSKQPESARAVSSNNQYYGTPVKKWWAQFCAKAKWDPVQKMQFLDVAGNPIDGTFRQFFVYLYEQDGMTKGVFKPCLQWAQAELNTQRENRLLAPMKAHVCNVPGVKNRKDEIYSNARQLHILHMTDLQADIESNIGPQKMLELVDMCLSFRVPGTNPMFSLQTLFEARATHQMCARHDDLRLENFAHMFARVSRVGGRSMPLLASVNDGGKTNQNGNVSYSAVVPHKNPLVCMVFAKGMAFSWRFCIMHAGFPDLLKPEDIFQRPALRQGNSEFAKVSYRSSADIMKRLYDALGVVVTKVLHQGRGEGQRSLDELQVPLDQIKRLCKYIHDDQTDSYLLSPPMAALLAAAGFDHTLPTAATAPHLQAAFDDKLIELFWPKLLPQLIEIDEAFKQAKSGADAKTKKLFCARGCGRALKLICETTLRCAAARPPPAISV